MAAEHLGFLIDENLSPDLAKLAKARGYHALHVNWARLRKKSDRNVAAYALDRDLILVTNNTVDFERIYRKQELHPGLVFLEVRDTDLMDRDSQRQLFEAALDSAAEEDPVNEAMPS